MPVILDCADFDCWLEPDTAVSELVKFLHPYPAGRMEAVAVGPAVNRVANDGPECVAPAA